MTNWQWIARAGLILSAALSAPVAADPLDLTAVELVSGIKANDNAYKMYALGVIRGLWSANISIKVNSKAPVTMYCPPESLDLTAEQAANILENYINKHTSTRNLSGGAELSYALIDIFPCH